MKTFTCSSYFCLLVLLLYCVGLGNSWAGTAIEADENQAPVITLKRLDTNFLEDLPWTYQIGKEAVIVLEVTDPDPGDVLTLSMITWSTTPVFTNATFTPELPFTATGPYTVEIRWTPTPEETSANHALEFFATDQHGASTRLPFEPYPYFELIFLPPTEPVHIAVGDVFKIPIAFTDNGDWWETPVFYSWDWAFDSHSGGMPVDYWTDGEIAPQGTQIYYVAFGIEHRTYSPTIDQVGPKVIEISAVDQPLAVHYLRPTATFTVVVDPDCTNKSWYRDKDGDGYGVGMVRAYACSQMAGYVDNNLDCDDTNAAIGTMSSWYADADGDSFGDPLSSLQSCSQPQGYVSDNTDCDDNDNSAYPGADELPGDGRDNNCNGKVDEVDGIVTCRAEKQLKLEAVCAEAAFMRRWIISNPNACAVDVRWEIHKSAQKGNLIAPPGDSYFSSQAIPKGADVAFIHWTDVNGKTKKKGMAAAAASCKDKGKKSRTAEAEMEVPDAISLYPLPFRDEIHLAHPAIHASTAAKISLISPDGRSLDVSALVAEQTDGQLLLNLRSLRLSNGLYILRIELVGEKPLYKRVIRQP